MPDENKDLNKSESVAQTDLNNVQSVAGQDLTQPVTEKLADGTDANKTVPYTELKKAIDEKKAIEQQAANDKQLYEQQMALMQNNKPQQTEIKQPASVYDQAKAELGLAGEEYIDESQRGKIYGKINEIMNAQNQQQNAAYANQQFEATHTDFSSVVGVRHPSTGVIAPSTEITKILMEKPYLTAAAYASSQGAYEIVMNERRLAQLQQQTTIQEEHLKTQGIDTKLAPVSGAAAAGGAVTTTGASVTIDQQREMEEKVASGEFQ